MPLILKVLPAILVVLLSKQVHASHALITGDKHEINAEPVTLFTRATDILNFNAISDGKKVYVNWISGSEKKYDYYTIEKAKDGVHFETAAMIKGAGNSIHIDYIDIDYSPYAGISYYRLKQTDYNGEVTYSDVVSVNYQFSKDGTVISCRDFEPIDTREISTKEILVVVRDEKGEEYFSKVTIKANTTGGYYATDIKDTLSHGSYTVIASSYNSLFSQNLTVQ